MTAARGLAAILANSTRRLCEQPELLQSRSEMGGVRPFRSLEINLRCHS
jgi:hypothetical protein